MNRSISDFYSRITSFLKQTLTCFLFLALLSPALRAEVTISEFMAVNDSSLMDVDGDYEDWIEIHNDSPSEVNLAGWFLTDKATDLQKWRFPSITIPANDYLVVFASSKDRRNPRAQLHTNFKLSGSGEYLALVQPDGTIANDFSPEYPAQAADVSFGTVGGVAGSVTIVSQGADAVANSPISEAEYLTDYVGWNTLGFVGETESATVTISWNSRNTWSNDDGTSDDDHKLSTGYLDDGNSGSGNGVEITLSGIPFSTYRVYGLYASDSGGSSAMQAVNFNVNGVWAYGGGSSTEATVYGSVNVNNAYNGENWTEIVPGSVVGNYWTVETSGSTCSIIGEERDGGARGSLTGIIIEPTGASAGAPISIDFADGTDKAFSGGQNIGPLESDSSNWFSTINRDFGTYDSGSMTINAITSGWQDGQTGIGYDTEGGYGSWIGTGGNVQDLSYNINPSVFVRVPFTVADTNMLYLTLRMRYDDGFRAYLNGTPVAEDAAPAEPAAWNDVATLNRDESENEQWTPFDLTPHIALLNAGENNVLAFQIFNTHSGSSDLLMLPELDAVYDGSNPVSYLLTPTPGTANGAGSMDIGPSVRDTTDKVTRPSGNFGTPDIVVTSKVVATLRSIQSVNLHYRYMFDPETTVAMTPIGNDLYTANVPVAGLGEGKMVRWRVEASDTSGFDSTEPAFIDPLDNEEYFGTSTIDTSYADSQLPVVEWFVEDYGASRTRGGTRCSLYYLDRFYDNVFIGLRGGSSSGFSKNPFKLDFNEDNDFVYKEGEDDVKDLRWMQNWSDKTKIHNTMSHEMSAMVGAPYHFTFPVRIQRNGAFEQITEFMENDDKRWLKRLDRDPEGALLKMNGETNGDKKTRRPYGPYYEVTSAEAAADDAAKNDLFNRLEWYETVDSRREYMYDNMNIPDCINYLVSANLSSHQDHGHKNYYIYRDTNNTGEWSIWLWDVDLSWGRNWYDSGGYLTDTLEANNPLDFNTPIQNKVYNRIYRAFHESPELREMYFSRLRTCMDEILQPPGTPTEDRVLESRFDYWLEQLDPSGVGVTDSDLDRAKWGYWGTDYSVRQEHARTKSEYLEERRQFLFNENPYALEIYGESAPSIQPSNAVVQIESIDFLPTSGNAMEEYFTLLNNNGYAVDISGWSVTGGVKHVFRPGTVIPAGGGTSENIGRLYVARQASAFRAKSTGPGANQFCFVQDGYKGQLSARGETLHLLDPTGRLVDQFAYAGTPTDSQNHLRISEIMYAPTDPTASELATQPYLLDTDFEFIELVNTGTSPIDLGGAQLTDGVLFTFPAGFSLPAGGYAIVAANTNAFPLRYGSSAIVAGQYDGYLNNDGETIVLLDSVGEKVLDFTYNDTWHRITDGHDFSLVIIDENIDWTGWKDSANWRASANLQGSPGAIDPAPPVIGKILVNEVLTHTDLPQVDTIELYNPEIGGVDIGGWFLTDDFYTPKKFRVPDGTMLNNDGYVTYDEDDFNTPTNLPTSFQLSSTGDEVWLFSANTQSNLTGYVHGFEFGAAQNGVSFGRYVTTIGEVHFPAQSALTLGFINAGPKVGPIVISEIMYHPTDLATTNNARDEYIELTNISGSSINLFDPAASTNTWRIRNAVDFDFPQSTTMASGSRILLVSFDPLDTVTLAAFRSAYGMSPSVPVYGPWSGTLNNGGDEIELKWPDNPNLDGSVPYILAEEVGYEATEPWPQAADGTGKSLQRIANDQYGDDPDNWYAATPQPGQAANLDLDSDTDTMNDWEEWKARTDPLDPNSYMHMGSPVHQPSGDLDLALYTVAGRRYALDFTTNLVTQPFAPLMEDIFALGDVTNITVTNSSDEACFYRMRLDP